MHEIKLALSGSQMVSNAYGLQTCASKSYAIAYRLHCTTVAVSHGDHLLQRRYDQQIWQIVQWFK